MAFQKATKQQAKLRAGLCGPSGSGKTFSSLLLARGLAGETGRIALIDTERRSASLYADVTDFDVADLAPPYTPARYVHLIKEASTQYDVLVIDSLTHAWSGEGGVLEMHDNATKADRSGNSYTAWRNVTPQHNQLVDAILTAPCHVIICMRTKTAYEMVDDGKGKKKPVKIGLAPIQRDGMEYEFTMVFDLSVDGNIATASKDRTNLWRGRNEVLTPAHGAELRAWLDSGEVTRPIAPPVPRITAAELAELEDAIRALNLDRAKVLTWAIAASKNAITEFHELTPLMLEQLSAKLPAMAKSPTMIKTTPEPEQEAA